jgi:type I restriction enzyme R subunit
LIQAYSRTNRLFDKRKPKGLIVNFRNLKKNTDKAIELYGNKDADGVIIAPSYQEQLQKVNSKIEELKRVVPEYVMVDDLKSEEEKAEFVKIFRDVMKLIGQISTYVEFE